MYVCMYLCMYVCMYVYMNVCMNVCLYVCMVVDMQNPPPIDFDQLKITANKMQNRSHSLDILKNDDQPHTNEVTYFKNHSADTYEV